LHGERVATQTRKFRIASLGQQTLYSDFRFPQSAGDFLLRAIVGYSENAKEITTQSRRHLKLVDPAKR
jgi:hypothetical protein